MAQGTAAASGSAAGGGGAPTPAPRRVTAAADDDDVCGAAFHAERPSVEGIDEACPRARRAGSLAVRAAAAAAAVALFRRLAASHPRAALALLVLAAAAGRWIQARAHPRRLRRPAAAQAACRSAKEDLSCTIARASLRASRALLGFC